MVLIICTKNESNLTNKELIYGFGRTKSADGIDRRTDDAKTISFRLRQGIIKTVLTKMITVRPRSTLFALEEVHW